MSNKPTITNDPLWELIRAVSDAGLGQINAERILVAKANFFGAAFIGSWTAPFAEACATMACVTAYGCVWEYTLGRYPEDVITWANVRQWADAARSLGCEDIDARVLDAAKSGWAAIPAEDMDQAIRFADEHMPKAA